MPYTDGAGIVVIAVPARRRGPWGNTAYVVVVWTGSRRHWAWRRGPPLHERYWPVGVQVPSSPPILYSSSRVCALLYLVWTKRCRVAASQGGATERRQKEEMVRW